MFAHARSNPQKKSSKIFRKNLHAIKKNRLYLTDTRLISEISQKSVAFHNPRQSSLSVRTFAFAKKRKSNAGFGAD